MSQSTKVQHYPYAMRVAAASAVTFCTDKILMFITPPENAISIEQLYCHFRMTFDAGIAAGDRVVRWIGIDHNIPGFTDEPARKITIDVTADGNRQVDIRLDLTSILDKTKCGYRSYYTNPLDNQQTYVVIKLDDDCHLVSNVGTINLWKLDALFTTTGIR